MCLMMEWLRLLGVRLHVSDDGVVEAVGSEAVSDDGVVVRLCLMWEWLLWQLEVSPENIETSSIPSPL